MSHSIPIKRGCSTTLDNFNTAFCSGTGSKMRTCRLCLLKSCFNQPSRCLELMRTICSICLLKSGKAIYVHNGQDYSTDENFSKASHIVSQSILPRGKNSPLIIPLSTSLPKQPVHHGIKMLKRETNGDYKQFSKFSNFLPLIRHA